MNSDLAGPADTSLMRIVHDGLLRRDQARAQHALTTAPYPRMTSGPLSPVTSAG